MTLRKKFISTLACIAIFATMCSAADVKRYKLPNSDFPILLAAEIPASATIVNLSGALASIKNTTAPKDSFEAYGSTEEQTFSALQNIEKTLKSINLEMGDIIKMQVFLVGDPKLGGKMDFDGFMNSYRKFFGNKKQPNFPTRSVFQVAGLAGPAYLVEIEVTAVRKSTK